MVRRNWQNYNQKLKQRGSLTFLIDPKLLKDLHPKRPKKKNGRPTEYSDNLILLLLMVKIQFNLTYRSLEGFALSVLEPFLKTTIPDYTLICKRAKTLMDKLPKLSGKRPSVILLDASGIKVHGEGEWKRKIHGKGRRSKWVKIHIAVDVASQEIVAIETTDKCVGDVSCAQKLVESSGKRVKTVMADGAYDSFAFRSFVNERGGNTLIPPRKNSRYRGSNSDRDDAIAMIEGLGGGLSGRSLWGKLSGYSARALVETAFSRLKSLFGCRMFSKTFERQKVENYLKCLILNKMI